MIMHKVTTLNQFIIERQAEIPGATGEFSRLLHHIGIAAKKVHREVNKAGLVDILGKVGSINVQGEDQQKLDVYADKTFMDELRASGECCGVATEENVAAQVVSGIGFIGAGTIIFQKQIVRGLTTAAGIWATAGIGLAVGAGMYTIGIAAMVLTLIGLELLSYLFKSIGMKSSMVSFSTSNKDTLKQIADRFNSKDYLIVSYEMETQHTGETEYYQVTMVIKSKRNNDEGHLLSLIQEFPDVTVQRIE